MIFLKFLVNSGSCLINLIEALVNRKEMAIISSRVERIFNDDSEVLKAMNISTRGYFLFILIEFFCSSLVILDRNPPGLLILIFNYYCVLITLRIVQIWFCMDFIKHSLTFILDDVKATEVLVKETQPNIDVVKNRILQVKRKYESLLDLTELFNQCAKFSLLAFVLICAGFIIYSFYYGLLNILKDIPVMSRHRKLRRNLIFCLIDNNYSSP